MHRAVELTLSLLVVVAAPVGAQTPNTPAAIATQITAGSTHTCALTAAGGVMCWGYNGFGELGDGTGTNSVVPVDVVGLAAVATATAGAEHNCVLTSTDGVACWGWNLYGQVGDGGSADRLSPVEVVGLGSGMAAVAAGGYHACAVTASGGVKCWGENSRGQLGDGSTTGSSTPVDVAGLGIDVVAVAAGEFHTCALTVAGGVKCWGKNDTGQLGNGGTASSTAPVDVTGLSSGVAAVSAGNTHTCALTTMGGVKCWGFDFYGQLGDGGSATSPVPVDVAGLGSGVIGVELGRYHTCAVTAAGSALCWGYNFNGELGDGSGMNSSLPVGVAGLDSGVAAISAGGYHSCAMTTSGGVLCWGSNTSGQLGSGDTQSCGKPRVVVGFGGGGADAIFADGFEAC